MKKPRKLLSKSTVWPVLTLSALAITPLFVYAQTFDRDLYFGLENDSDVTKLQEFLTDQGIYSGPITGNFFSLTLSAVKTYQIQNNISPATGYFGPKTRTIANTGSSQQATQETSTAAPTITPQPTPNDLLSVLTQLLTLLQQQKQSQDSQLLTQQQTIEKLNTTINTQQQAITNIEDALLKQNVQSSPPFQPIIAPYFVADIASDKDSVKNDGVDEALVVFTVKSNTGQILTNQWLTLKIADSSGTQSLRVMSDNQGIIRYQTKSTTVKFMYDCGSVVSAPRIAITITDGIKSYFKTINIIDTNPPPKLLGGPCA